MILVYPLDVMMLLALSSLVSFESTSLDVPASQI